MKLIWKFNEIPMETLENYMNIMEKEWKPGDNIDKMM